MITTRKMGFLEKIAIQFQEAADGSTSVAAMIKIDSKIDFDHFTHAWQIMFARQPMLRARKVGEDLQWSFVFDVKFNDIDIKQLKCNDISEVNSEYSHAINRTFDTHQYLWRTTLASTATHTYIIIGVSHAISDAKSLSWLLGDLLRCLTDIENGNKPDNTSYPIPKPLFQILDHKQFSPPAKPDNPPEQNWAFEGSPTMTPPLSKNLLCHLETEVLSSLVDQCHKHHVTITAAITAAMAKTLWTLNLPTKEQLIFSIAVNLRPYTEPRVADRVLAFYAHQILFVLQQTPDISVWELAQQALKQYQQSLKQYRLVDADDHATLTELKQLAANAIKSEQCFIPPTLSNVGVVDPAFHDCGRFKINDFFFTVQNQLLFSIIVFTATINNRLCINFNYCDPVISDESMQHFANHTLTLLKQMSGMK